MKLINILFIVDTLFVDKDKYFPVHTNGSLVLGQDYDGKATKENFDPGFDPLQSFSGKFSQMEIWNAILTPVEVQKLANCDISTTKSRNRILTWKTENWKLSGQTRIYDIPLKNLCLKNTLSNQFIWPKAITFEKFSSYCNLINGIPPLIYKNSQENEVYNEVRDIFVSMNKTFLSGFLDKTRREGIQCFVSKTSSNLNFWLGMKWNYIERKWYSPFFKPSLDLIEFKKEIDEEYNANACTYFKKNTFNHSPCQKKYPCGICKVPQEKLIYLKGLCEYGYDIFDFQYYVHGLKNNRPYFK